jgi:hypothetical protein
MVGRVTGWLSNASSSFKSLFSLFGTSEPAEPAVQAAPAQTFATEFEVKHSDGVLRIGNGASPAPSYRSNAITGSFESWSRPPTEATRIESDFSHSHNCTVSFHLSGTVHSAVAADRDGISSERHRGQH